MRIVEMSNPPGRTIEQFGSVEVTDLGGARFGGRGGVTFLSFRVGSHLGRHPTALAQLFCVVRGSGWVAGADGERLQITSGHAALFDPGELHDSGSEEGMDVVVLEAPTIQLR